MIVRSGLGFDLHPLVDDRPLILGGVTVPAERGLDGCSRTPIRATKEPRASGCCGR